MSFDRRAINTVTYSEHTGVQTGIERGPGLPSPESRDRALERVAFYRTEIGRKTALKVAMRECRLYDRGSRWPQFVLIGLLGLAVSVSRADLVTARRLFQDALIANGANLS